MNEEPRKRRAGERSGGRAGNKMRAGTAVIDQMPWRIPVNPDRPTEPLDAEGVLAVHKTAMRILKEIGIEFLNPEAVAQAVADLQGTEVARAREVWRKKFGQPPADLAERGKQMRFLASRGFGGEAIRRVVQGAEDDDAGL